MKKSALFLLSFLLHSFSSSAQTKVKEVGLGLSNLNVFNTDAYSLNYRWGKSEKLFTIRGGLNLNSNFDQKNNIGDNFNDTLVASFTNDFKQETPYNIGLNLSINTINLKPINEKFGFFYGFGLGIGFNTNKTNTESIQISISRAQPNLRFEQKINSENTTTSIRPSLFAPIGFYYNLGKSFRIYAEISPTIYYSHTIYENKNSSSIINYDNNKPIGLPFTRNDQGSGKINNFGFNFSNWNSFFTIVYRWEK